MGAIVHKHCPVYDSEVRTADGILLLILLLVLLLLTLLLLLRLLLLIIIICTFESKISGGWGQPVRHDAQRQFSAPGMDSEIHPKSPSVIT